MNKYYIIFIFLSLALAGCSFHYSVKDFGNKKIFYKNFNEAFYGRSATIQFKKGEVLKAGEGMLINNDTLYGVKTNIKEVVGGVALSSLEKINYPASNNNIAIIILKDGKKYSARSLSTIHDSLHFVELKTIYSLSEIAPISSVKKISYKSKSGNVIPGLTVGAIAGALAGAVKTVSGNSSGDNMDKLSEYILIYTAAGAAIGAITNWLLGTNYIYIFNN